MSVESDAACEALYQFATSVCRILEKFQPQVLVSLAHSDIGPLRAVQTCWKAKHSEDFPALVRINFGVEKHAFYQDYRSQTDMGTYDAQTSGVVDAYHMHYWFGQQEDWKAGVQLRVAQALGREITPERILILDELTGSTTRYCIFGLLHGLYPNAALKFVAGRRDWSNSLGEAWLETFFPLVYQEVKKLQDTKTYLRRFPTELHEPLKQMVVGSEDICAVSLDVRGLEDTDTAVIKFGELGIPARGCLECSGWVLAQIETYILKRVSGEFDPPPQDAGAEDKPIKCFDLDSLDRAWIEVWKQDGVSIRRWAEIRGISLRKARQEILKEWRFYQNLQPAGFGSQTVFRVEAGFLPNLVGTVVRQPVMEFCDGKILAGPYPGWSLNYSQLIERRVGCIIDLTTASFFQKGGQGFPNKDPDAPCPAYYDDLREDFHAAGLDVEIHTRAIQPYQVPGVAGMVEILDLIDRAVASGRVVYLHDRAGNGRAAMVAGCYLVRHGLPAPEALAVLKQQLAHTYIRAYRVPGTEGQRRCILQWKPGE